MIYNPLFLKNSVIWSWHLEATWYRYNGKPCHFIPADHWAFSAVFHTTSTWRLSGEGSCSALAMRMISFFFNHTEYAFTLKNVYECAHASISACICACIISHIHYTELFFSLRIMHIIDTWHCQCFFFARSRPLVRFWPHKSRWHLVSFRRWSYLCQRHLFACDISCFLVPFATGQDLSTSRWQTTSHSKRWKRLL